MKAMIAIGLVALATGQSGAQSGKSPDRFNLECAGTLFHSSVFSQTTEPYRSVYRIDLGQGKWCEEDCKFLHDIQSVGPTQITLQEKRVDTFSERSTTMNLIDRVTGEHRVLAASSNPRDRKSVMTLKWEGKCSKATFTGFPTFETKF